MLSCLSLPTWRLTDDWAKTAAASRVSIDLASGGLGNVVGEADLPEHEIGLATANIQSNGPIGVVEDVAFSQVGGLGAVVIARAEIKPERLSERDYQSAAKNTGTRPVAVIGMARILDQIVRIRNAGLGREMHRRIGRARVRPEPAIRNLELESKRAELDLVVGVEIELYAGRTEEPERDVFVPVPNATHVGANAEPALRIKLV